ncbi:MAG: nicotinate-nucleotide adenylyltransferase [Bacteroidota bacterium]
MNPVGLFGGTFDPIHIGHLITAQSVLEMRNLSKIIFMPTFVSPLKVDYHSASSEDRAKMVELAIKDYPNFELSRYEIEMRRISYTVDTLKYLKKSNKHLELIIGYDNFLLFNKWKNPDQILDMAKIIVLNRKVKGSKDIVNDERFIFLDNPTIEINSTEIRNRVENNMSIEFLVLPKIKEYIIKHNLYSDSQ